MSSRVHAIAAVALAALALALPSSAAADDPIGPIVVRPPSDTVPPPSFKLSAVQATGIAARVSQVHAARRSFGRLRPVAYILGPSQWEVDWYQPTRHSLVDRVEVDVNGLDGHVFGVWTGFQVTDPLARGHMADHADNAWIWIVLSVLFVAPFFDLRRPFRLLHLDLLVIVSLTASYAFFTAGNVGTSVPLVYPVLLYLLARALWAGFRPRPRRELLVPHIPARWLAVSLFAVIAGRIALNIVNAWKVIDVGYAGVVGASRIMHGLPLYVNSTMHGDTYGPFNYLAYIPFELVFPWHGRWDTLPAAHAAAITFDLLTIAGLYVLGTRLRRGLPGRRLGIALAFGWAACPFTMLALATNVNDALIAALLVFALVAIASPPVRGLLLGLGAAAKFAPLALAPLFAGGLGVRRRRDVAVSAAIAAGVLALTVFAYLPKHGGLQLFWDQTVHFQMIRATSFSLWAQHPALRPVQTAIEIGAAGLALTVAFFPRRRDTIQVAALGAAVLIAVELAAKHWFYFYVAWFLPFVLVALFARHETGAAAAPDEIESAAFAGSGRTAGAPLP